MATPYECSQNLIDEVKKAVKGKDECIQRAFATILARGHILIEDVPGVGKTTLAMAFSNAMGLKNQRVQFTPDVMPAICFWQTRLTVPRLRHSLHFWK